MKGIDLLTVLYASVIYFFMFVIWHSNFLFKKIYNLEKKKKSGKKKKIFFYHLLVFILILISSYVIASFEVLLSVTSFWDGVVLGFLFWLGFVCTHSMFFMLKYKKDLRSYVLDNILYLIGLMVVSGIIAG